MCSRGNELAYTVHAYSCLFGGCYRNTLATATVMAHYSCSSHSLSLSSSSQSSLKRMRLRFLRFKQRQSRKKALLLISLSICLVFRLTLQPRSVWTIPLASESLCRSTWLPLLFYGRHSQMSPTRSESACLRLSFFVYISLLNRAVPCSTGPACRASTARFCLCLH